jgi:hypothetical protein
MVDLAPIWSLNSFAYSTFSVMRWKEKNLFFDINVVVEHDTDEYERLLLTEINLIAAPAPSYCNQLRYGFLFRPMHEGFRVSFLIKLQLSFISADMVPYFA